MGEEGHNGFFVVVGDYMEVRVLFWVNVEVSLVVLERLGLFLWFRKIGVWK